MHIRALLFATIAVPISLSAQSPAQKRALSAAQAGDLAPAKQLIRQNGASHLRLDLARIIAQNHVRKAEFDSASVWYAEVVSEQGCAAQDLFDYAQVLRCQGGFSKADHWIERFSEQHTLDSRVARLAGSVEYGPRLQNVYRDTRKVERPNALVQRTDATASMHAGGTDQSNDVLTVNGISTWDATEHLAINGKRLWFARELPGGYGGSDIYFKERQGDGPWSDPINAGPVVNTEGDEISPYSDEEGDLYFASDGHAGLGGSDIQVALLDGGVFQEVRNLGAPINGPFNERGYRPDSEGRSAVFLSDRNGAMDILTATLEAKPCVRMHVSGCLKDRTTKKPLDDVSLRVVDEMGVLLNSTTTDSLGRFSLNTLPGAAQSIQASKAGYREAETTIHFEPQEDTAFFLNLPLAYLQEVTLWAHVSDRVTSEPLDSVEISLSDVEADNVRIVHTYTDKAGDVREPLAIRSIGDSLIYRLGLERKGFFPKHGLFLYKVDAFGTIPVHENMDPKVFEIKSIEIGDEVGKELGIGSIPFATGSHRLAIEAEAKLDSVAALLVENMDIMLEIRCHTDGQGSPASNLALSRQRAKAICNRLREKGISAMRLADVGLGESVPLKGWAARRTELIVTAK